MYTGMLALGLFLGVVITSVYLIYVKAHPQKYTRERYAFSCLITSSSLIGIAIAAISSKEGMVDHIYNILLLAFDQETPPPEPASMTEKVLITILVAFALHHIWKSYREDWPGLISVDEMNRRRKSQSPSLLAAGVEEGIRLLKRAPPRTIFDKTDITFLQAVLKSPSHDVVWHEHARQLFELWDTNVAFRLDTDGGWDERWKCWYGSDRRTSKPLILFCPAEQPTDDDIKVLVHHLGVPSSIERPSVYTAVRHATQEHSTATVDGVEITTITEKYLLDHIADFSDYLFDIKRRIEETKLPESNLTIRDIYVPSFLEASDESLISTNMETHLGNWAAEPAGRQIVVLGEYGQGKSTGALMFVYRAFESKLSSSGGRIPILIELRGKSPANLLPAELIATWAQQYRIQALSVIKLLMAGRLIMIFEGFDEMANVADMESRLAHFRSLWQFSYRDSKLLFTGRRNLFFLEREIDLVFGGADRNPADPSCEIVHLRPFDLKQIEHGLRWVEPHVRNGILRVAKENEQMLDIVSRPSLLYIVARLWPELERFADLGTMTSATVIGKFIEHSYRRQAEKAIGSPNFMSLLEGERRYFHEGLAVYMATKAGASNQITQVAFTAAIEQLYKEYPDDCHLLPPAMMEGTPRTLKARLADADNQIEQVSTDVRTHGILVSDIARRGAFKFAHKSFFEALNAKVAAYGLLDTDPDFYNAIERAIDYPPLGVVQSPEIVTFFAETFFERISLGRGPSTEADDIMEQSFDKILGIKTKRRIIREFRRIIMKKSAEVQFSRYGRMVLLIATAIFPMFALAFSWTSINIAQALSAVALLFAAAIASVGMVSLMIVGSGISKTSFHTRLCLWVAVFLFTNHETYLVGNRVLSKRATEELVRLANKRWGVRESQSLSSVERQR